ncbi:hypothetical protein AOLI_G00133780 [Acnodon oligacanthus]
MLLFTDKIEAESLGCEVMSAADTEAEASTYNIQTHLDETDATNDQPLVGGERASEINVLLRSVGCTLQLLLMISLDLPALRL